MRRFDFAELADLPDLAGLVRSSRPRAMRALLVALAAAPLLALPAAGQDDDYDDRYDDRYEDRYEDRYDDRFDDEYREQTEEEHRYEEGRERRYGPRAGDWEATLTGSGANNNDWDAGSIGATGSIGYFFTDWLELLVRQSLNYADAEGVDSTTFGSTRIGLDFHLPLDRFYPFIGANFGGIYGDNIDETWTAAPVVGMKFYAREKTFLFAQGEYQFFFDDADEADEAFDDGIFIYSIGIGFNW